MTTLICKIPEGLSEKLETESRRRRVSKSAVVRRALESALSSNGGSKAPGTALARSLYDLTSDLCGSVRGGPGDLATNRKHLHGYGKWKR